MGTWSDFVGWWKRVWRRDLSGDYLPVTPDSTTGESEPGPAPEKSARLIHWPGSRRDRQLAALQQGYVEMLGLMRGIREHLEKQQGVQEKMVQVLDRLPDSMDGLKNVGRAAEQQVEVMSLLRQQIEAGVSHDQQLVESMNRFNQTLSVMDQTSRTSGRAVEQLIGKASDSEKMLRDTMEHSERRFMIVTGVFALIAVLMVGTVLALVWFGRAMPAAEDTVAASPTTTEVSTPAAPTSPELAEGLPPGAIPMPPEVTEETPPVAGDAPPPEVVEPAEDQGIEPPPAEEIKKPTRRSRRKTRQAAREPEPVEADRP
ncbi:MAG: hypothetical protein KKC51_05370 [Verrucomicrobia bacterium]|nr:hypothetical protein [Verrucomicrobiota bacterium]